SPSRRDASARTRDASARTRDSSGRTRMRLAMHRRVPRAVSRLVSYTTRHRVRVRSDRRRLRVGVASIALLLTSLLFAYPRSESVINGREPGASGSDSYDWAAPENRHPDPHTFAVGVTHTQYSIDDWGSDKAKASAKA